MTILIADQEVKQQHGVQIVSRIQSSQFIKQVDDKFIVILGRNSPLNWLIRTFYHGFKRNKTLILVTEVVRNCAKKERFIIYANAADMILHDRDMQQLTNARSDDFCNGILIFTSMVDAISFQIAIRFRLIPFHCVTFASTR